MLKPNSCATVSPFIAKKAILRSIIPMAHDNHLFEFSEPTGSLRSCQPGQFVQLWLPGVGECPISVCSGRVSDTIQLMVRRVGRVTKALFQLKEGDWVGLRGPFGKGFPVEHFRGQNLCLIAGGLGIAPIRSLWQYVLDHREEFGRLILVYGMKHSEDLLFGQELRLLMQRRDVEVFLAAEDTNVCLLPAVSMPVGRVTNLIELAALDSSFSAAVCGPPVMYRFVVESLNKRGITDDRIWLSLERHMKCGMGKCGHCFMGGKFICQAGPVMQLNELHLTPEVVELVER